MAVSGGMKLPNYFFGVPWILTHICGKRARELSLALFSKLW